MTPGPALTLTLSGGAHLSGFRRLSVRALRGFDPRSLGRACLRGPYLRVNGSRTPPMNVPTTYPLPHRAPVLLVWGQSLRGTAADVLLALTVAPGDRIAVPLTTVTPAQQAMLGRVAQRLDEARWTFARTMPEHPHFYSARTAWTDPGAFEEAVAVIQQLGHRQAYSGATYTVLALNTDLYWTGWEAPTGTRWINRKPLPHPAPPLVDQTLVIEGGRVLEVPSLPDGWRGLPAAKTTCPHVRVGVAVFGYQAPPTARLVRRS